MGYEIIYLTVVNYEAYTCNRNRNGPRLVLRCGKKSANLQKPAIFFVVKYVFRYIHLSRKECGPLMLLVYIGAVN